MSSYVQVTIIIIHSTYYLFSDWLKAYKEFSKQRLGRDLATDYTIIMSRTLKVTGNHVMYDRGAWFLRVIMSSSRALCCLPSVKKQKHDFQVCFFDHRLLPWSSKNNWRQGHTKHKMVDEGGKELFTDYMKEKTLNEPEEMTFYLTFYVKARKKERIRSMYNKTLIRFLWYPE